MDIQKFRNIPFDQRSLCAVCERHLSPPVINLPQLPLTEIYINHKERERVGFADQGFNLCNNCGHGQLSHIISPSLLYGTDTYYLRTSESRTARKANDYFVAFIKKYIRRQEIKTIIDIGSSDLYLLKALKKEAPRLIGIDPMLKGRKRENSDDGIEAVGEYFEKTEILKSVDPETALVLSSHTLEHLEEPRDIITKLFQWATVTTRFIFQFPSLEPMLQDARYDQIFHQHLHYFSLPSFHYLLSILGGELIDYTVNYYHWGALLAVFKKRDQKVKPKPIIKDKIDAKKIKKDYLEFRIKMKGVNKFIESLYKEKIYGFGASLMLPILSYHLGNDFSQFLGILDDDPSKNGLYYINLPVKIRRPESVQEFSNVTILITAVNTPRSVLPRVLELRPKRIIIPIPTV